MRMDSWLESMPADVDGQKPWSEEDLLAMGPVPVPGNAGDVYAPYPDPLSDPLCDCFSAGCEWAERLAWLGAG